MSEDGTITDPRDIGEPASKDVPKDGLVLLRRYRLDSVMYTSGWGDFWLAEDLGEMDVPEGNASEGLAPVRILALRSDVPRSKKTLRALRVSVDRASRLHREGLSAARQLFTVGEHWYVLCDPIEGFPLFIVLKRAPGGRLPYEQLKGLATALADVLDYAHKHGVVNSNIRPGAVTVWSDGTLAGLSGFGIRESLGGGRRSVMDGGNDPSSNRLGYLAPEILEHHWAEDDASDQYALAALMWHGLLGKPPRPGGSPPIPPEGRELAPAAALAALERGLAKAPRARYASCADFARAFGGERVTKRRGLGVMERRLLWRRARQVVLGVAAVAVVAALVGGIFYGAKLLHDKRGARKVVHDIAPAAAGGPIQEIQTALTGAMPLKGATEVATPGQPFKAGNGMEFVWVPIMRCWVGRFEVTNGEYKEKEPTHNSGAFNGVSLDEDRQPAVRLRFTDAEEFAEWMNKREQEAGHIPEGWVVRLPDRLEAVQYAQAGLDRTYPWGDRLPPRFGNYADAALREETGGAAQTLENYRDSFVGSCPVEYSGENDWGLFGTGGNVWETTLNPNNPSEFGGWHGGAYDTGDPQRITTTSFYGYLGNARGAVNGMRLIIAKPKVPANAGTSAQDNGLATGEEGEAS